MSQYETPLFTALVEHSKRNPIQFHIPGHKKGQGMDPEFREFLNNDLIEAIGSTPEEMRAFLPKDREKWEKIIKDAGVSAAN